MTVTGPIIPTDVLPVGPGLCREWLLNDQSSLLQRLLPPDADGEILHNHSHPSPGDRVEFNNLMSMRRWPLAALNNLHLSRDDAIQELCGAVKLHHNGGFVVICTPRAFWTSPTAPSDRAVVLQGLSRESGLPIVSGTAPAPGQPTSETEFETEVARLESDLLIGYEAVPAQGGKSSTSSMDGANRVRPGLLGELPLWDPTHEPPTLAQVLSLRVCVEVQRRTNAPLLLSGPVCHEAFAILDGAAGPPGTGPCIWERCAFFDVPPESPISAAQLSARGSFLGFCPPPAAADISWQPYLGRRPWKTEEAFLKSLANAPVGRTLVSSGMRFRTDLVAYGGGGLAHAPDLLFSARWHTAASCNMQPLPDETALRAAAIAFLQYPWRPTPPPEKIVLTISCHWCGAQKNEGEHFSKLGFTYCSPQCIAKHRKFDFDPDMPDRK